MSFPLWILFSVLAVSDARENKIPNIILCFLFGFTLLEVLLLSNSPNDLALSFVGAGIFFGVGILLYCFGCMAAGDAKLLAVVGFIMGWGNLVAITIAISCASVVVGSFYCFQYLAYKPTLLEQTITRYKLVLYGGLLSSKPSGGKSEDKIRMPFAPIVVIGLAWHHYFY